VFIEILKSVCGFLPPSPARTAVRTKILRANPDGSSCVRANPERTNEALLTYSQTVTPGAANPPEPWHGEPAGSRGESPQAAQWQSCACLAVSPSAHHFSQRARWGAGAAPAARGELSELAFRAERIRSHKLVMAGAGGGAAGGSGGARAALLPRGGSSFMSRTSVWLRT